MINLSKGDSISLEKKSGTGGLARVALAAGWDMAKGGWFSGGGGSIDLDASVLIYEGNSHVDTVWYGGKRSKDGHIQHSGDNLTGAGDGDDETITVDLDKLDNKITKVVFTLTSYSGQTFAKVSNAFARVYDRDTNDELGRFEVSDSGEHTALVLAMLHREAGGQWQFKAIGERTRGKVVNDLIPTVASLI